MNNYEKIKTMLELGTLKGVAIQKDGKWSVFKHIDGDGKLNGTYWGASIERSLKYYISNVGCTEKDCEEYSNITPIPQKPKVLEVGTMVRVLDIAMECGDYKDWREDKKAMIGSNYKIENVCDDNEGVSYNLSNYLFPAYCVVPSDCLEEETIEVAGKIYLRSDYAKAIKNLKEIK